ncbi:Leucine-rich repeat-containing G-protein coupled receptor 6 [Dissostichus eleginoides]|uniref:Leucine-rich repeat-containing G-protein coupled receptor 6 n=1 Tax=Dissostichus eleginoides TaxID=100907 RepID=A0AAD9CE14_DISEL|nr:Leucine-rich repeat-containing G-protein coupled receptor 6 [Dissostichus eleginoides]
MLSVLLILCVAGGVLGSAPGVWGYGRAQDRQGPAAPLCPSPCQCEEDGIFVMVDCSELGLASVPTNLSPLTTYLVPEDRAVNTSRKAALPCYKSDIYAKRVLKRRDRQLALDSAAVCGFLRATWEAFKCRSGTDGSPVLPVALLVQVKDFSSPSPSLFVPSE